jgi:formylglycine-generating enzyme required for sulfatase activity
VKPPVLGAGPGGSDYSYENKPVVFVSWFDAARFANWMHNGQGNGDVQTGAYTFEGGLPVPANASTVTRNPGAKWFLPSEDEWYKAAYYDGGAGLYYDFATGSDTAPDNNLPSADTGNSANYHSGGTTTGDGSYPFTDAGAYTLSASPYGTLDQTGSMHEWLDTLTPEGGRVQRGGSWNETAFFVSALSRGAPADPTVDYSGNYGFRLAAAAVPEAGAFLLGGAAAVIALGLCWWPRARHRDDAG